MRTRQRSALDHWRGGWGGKGDHPRTVTPLPFVTKHNISLAGRGNNGETGLWRSTSVFLYSSDRFCSESKPRLTRPEPQGQAKKDGMTRQPRLNVGYISVPPNNLTLMFSVFCNWRRQAAIFTGAWPRVSKGHHDSATFYEAYSNALITCVTKGLVML